MQNSCLALLLLVTGCGSDPDGTPVELPHASPGIGFDDLRYSHSLHRVLAPAGRSGRLDMVDPETLEVTAIEGFSETADFSGGHDDGPTSVEEARGLLFVTDRTSRRLSSADPATRKIVGSVDLAAQPDYVRFVEARSELWVTEPDASQIEIFSLASDPANPAAITSMPIDNGPESLVIDAKRARAYTHHWQASTMVIDTATRELVDEWPNGCAASRGIALDETRGFLFVACSEGTLSVIDVEHGGKIVSFMAKGAGFDVIGYSPKLSHLYLAGSACDCLLVIRVEQDGALHFVARFDAPDEAHCAAADDVGNAWVCDPDGGRLMRVPDPQR